MSLSKMFMSCVILVLLMSAEQVSSNLKICYLLSDIVFAVDTTSSQNPSDFNTVKSEVKKLAENFTVGQTVRFALVSIADSAHVVVSFDAVSSLADFKKAVDRLSYSTETADLSEGIRLSKDSLLDRARPKASKILILVKDKRRSGKVVYDSNVLSRMKSEAKRVKSLKATINVVGIGGLWSSMEVEAIYGPQYLMFKREEKAFESIKKLKGESHCEPKCTMIPKNTSQTQGHCYGSLRHNILSRVGLTNPVGFFLCRKEIIREFQQCSDENKRCDNFVGKRIVGKCNPTTQEVNVDVVMEYFAAKEQACVKHTKSSLVKCSKVDECPQQVAEIVFVLDRSGSIDTHFSTLTDATAEMVKSLNIGNNHVRVGVISYSDAVRMEIRFGEVNDKGSLLDRINRIDKSTEGTTNTHLALAEARNTLTVFGRAGVTKLVILITDGESNDQSQTLHQVDLLKLHNIGLYVVGLAHINLLELEAMTAPETRTTMDILKDFSELRPWSQKFSKTLCLRLSPPALELCHDKVFLQSVTKCQNGVRYIASTRYTFRSMGRHTRDLKCFKTSTSTKSTSCKKTCLSPTDGNEYVDGDTWESLCYTFKCEDGTVKITARMCMAYDGSCRNIDAPPFKCRDENKKETDNCKCIKTSWGAAALAIDETKN